MEPWVPDRDEIAQLVNSLGLEDRKAEILLEDISLLALYLLPKVAQRIRIGRDTLIDTLRGPLMRLVEQLHRDAESRLGGPSNFGYSCNSGKRI